ncbi:MAG: ABC transporter substrate-binding protein [Bdellovibrionaceae bacterium]|nr:ABC transporter substrate-binding protein [Pseudobdellovibrionaceae bacterium]|tara:strand:+ start:1711 stop:3303 length:1593 start_codon:yes stop_codon:yes gene_type:complete
MTKLILSFLLGLSLVQTASAAEDILVYCSEASPSTFNPQLASDGPSFTAAASTVFNRLIEFKYGTTDLVPALAESWKISKDGKVYTFTLRKDVSFHSTKGFTPSRKMNADDVLFSFERMKDKNHPYHNVSGGAYEYFQSLGMGELIDKIVKTSDHQVEFHLKRAHSPFLTDLATSFAVIHSKEYADQLLKSKKQNLMDIEPVGTGPYELVRYVKDSSIRFKANENYFRGVPKIKTLVFSITPDPSVRFQKLKTGECQLIAEPSPTDIEAMKKNPQIEVISQPGLNVGYMAFNVTKAPLNNAKVRRAVAMALNRKEYLKLIYLNTAELAKNPIPPTLWSYDKSTPEIPYNVQKAKALLKEAGYPNGLELTLWTLPVSRPYNPNGKKMGELMQADLAKIGVKLKLLTFDWPTYLDKGRKGEHQLIHLGWISDTGDPDNFFGNLLTCKAKEGGSNYAQWCNAQFDKEILAAQKVTSQKSRTAHYKKAQKIFAKELPWVPLAHARVYRAFSKKLKGYKIHPIGVEEFYPLEWAK